MRRLRLIPSLVCLLAVCVLLQVAACPTQAEGFATHLLSFGRGPLWEVQALAGAPDGQLVVCDYGQVRKYAADGYGAYQHLFSVAPDLASVACSPNGEVYIGHGYWRSEIVRISAEGEVLDTTGSMGDPEWQGLAGLALAPDGTVYASYQRQGSIKHFTPDLQLISSWPTPELDSDFLYRPGPEALAVDGTGNVWMGWNGGEYRLICYSPTASC